MLHNNVYHPGKYNKVNVALGSRLRQCRNVITLGVKTNFSEYTEKEAELILKASKIYYPSAFYADLFDTVGKEIFPSYHTYKCVQDKIKQSALFELLDIPRPKTKVFYGRNRHENILKYFDFPFIAKIPRGSAMGRGVFLIRNHADLMLYCGQTTTAYIQEYLSTDRDIRAVVIGDHVAIAYWRIAPLNDFRSNIAVGGAISFEPVPAPVLDLALYTARKCGWNDVGLDIIPFDGNYYVVEANMKYGRQGFQAAGIDYAAMMAEMIDRKEI